MMDYKKEVAKILFDTKAVFINTKEPFIWASGIKSPIYCDNRVLISYVAQREQVAQFLANLIEDKFKDIELLAATATGAIAHGAFVSSKLKKPMVYILSKNKTHGRGKKIEGFFEAGQKTVVLEDLISTGNSSIAAINSAREQGLEVLGCVSIFSYGFDESFENFKKIDTKYYSLLTLDDLLNYAKNSHIITSDDVEVVKKFIANPHGFME